MASKQKPKTNADLHRAAITQGDEFVLEFKKFLRGESIISMQAQQIVDVFKKTELDIKDFPFDMYYLSVCRCSNCGKYQKSVWPAQTRTSFWEVHSCRHCLTQNSIPLIQLPASKRGVYTDDTI